MGLGRLEKTQEFPEEMKESIRKMLDFKEWVNC